MLQPCSSMYKFFLTYLVFFCCSVFEFMIHSIENAISLFCLANYHTTKTWLRHYFLQESCPAHHHPPDKWSFLSLLLIAFIVTEVLAKGANSSGSIKSSLAHGAHIGWKAVSGYCRPEVSCSQLSQRTPKVAFTSEVLWIPTFILPSPS